MDQEDLYDDFGNYIGPEQSDSGSDSDSLKLPEKPNGVPEREENEEQSNHVNLENQTQVITSVHDSSSAHPESQAIVLAEDKQYYASAEDIFGPDTEVLVEEEDAQDITEPVIAPVLEPSSGLHEDDVSIPPAKYSRTFLASAVFPQPMLLRSIALVGHLHHGKSTFADMLFNATHEMPWDKLDDRDLPVRYMDTRHDEQQLRISVKTTASTFLLQTRMEKSFGVTILDTPGHVNFLDEAIAAMNLVDGVAVVVDVAEGVMMGTEVLLRRACEMRLDILLVISKLDRLCLELRLPPSDAYHKIRHIVDSVNDIITPHGVPALSPVDENVIFSSASERVCFTLHQFADMYIQSNGGAEMFPMSVLQLARRFWGDVYYDEETRKFSKTNLSGVGSRTFVSFILEPFYKLHTAVVSEDVEELTMFLQRNNLLRDKKKKQNGIKLGSVNPNVLEDDLKALLKNVNSNAFGMGSMTGFVEALVKDVKSPLDAAERKLEVMSKGVDQALYDDSDATQEWIAALKECDTKRSSPMAAYVGKLIPDERGLHFDCLVRILSGKLCVGDTVRVLGNAYVKGISDEDQATGTISGIFVPCARFKIGLKEASAGQLVLLQGIDNTVFKSATIVCVNHDASSKAFPLRPLREYLPAAVVKVAVEPIRPSELPKMVSSLRLCVNSYPGLITKVEETGEHTLLGSGELYMDCILRDLREAYGKIEVKVSDPVVPFAETVSDTSALQCYADTPNGKNKLVMVAEPLEEGMIKALEDGRIEASGKSSSILRDFGWDALAAKSLWTFGPHRSRGPNALLNDVLIQDSRRRSEDIRESIVQGFCWAMREGPLADEPVRGVRVRLLDAEVAENEVSRTAAQIIPTCRRVVYSCVLTGNPRLMEPVYVVEIICASESLGVCYLLVGRRRGVVISEGEVAGTPLKRVMVHMPVLDSFGFEADLRNLTHGSGFCMLMFDHWSVVPGDPLDKSVELRPLEPAGRRELARECMLKTRRRKGMTDEVCITKYFDDPLLVELAADNEELRQLL